MSEFIIHGHPASPFLRSVCLGLEEKHAPYRIQEMAVGELRGEVHRRLHPFGRIPVLQHGDYHLYETQAILRYIDAVMPTPPLQPTDAKAIGRMNQIIGINDWYFFPKAAAVIVFQRILGPAFRGSTADEAAIAAAAPTARTCIGELDRLLGPQPFLAGETLSIADLMLAPQIDFFAQTPEGQSLVAGTRLEDWLRRMNARPSMQATQRPEALRRAA